jgi:hypothetical protein
MRAIFTLDLAGDEGNRLVVGLQGDDTVTVQLRLGGEALAACLPLADARRLADALAATLKGEPAAVLPPPLATSEQPANG